ncbi:NAD(P)-dependent oxidoreductase [Chromohalobacter israelensis]|uniref:NAD(P)-dependent oxidoreductase n=1 Tax=Chromohalobacter israelensis TaxID=141390 RepID=UPI000A01A29A|nr:NAD(P)-dependent oxidoreductase [Chromohalobacter israelensis]
MQHSRSNRMKIGFIGLGAMGCGMASQLLEAGHEVTVWNRSTEAVEALTRKGAKAAKTPADAARHEVLVSMLADDQAAHQVLIESKAVEAMKKGSVHINMATVSVAFARGMTALHDRLGVAYIAAPVLGRPDVAAAGKLNIIAAGDPAQIERVRPVLDAMGQAVWPLGESPERANVVKIAANFMLATAIESMAEASTLTRAYGIEASDFLDFVTNTLFASPAYQGYGKMIAEARFEPAGFTMRLGHKDVGLALRAGDERHVALPLGSAVRDRLLDALAHGDGEKDWSGLAEVAARQAHLDMR